MKSQLPLIGRCHLCGKETPYAFCCQNHCSTYYTYLRRGADPSTWQPRSHEPKHKTPQKYYGVHKSPLTIEQRVEQIAQRNITPLAPAREWIG